MKFLLSRTATHQHALDRSQHDIDWISSRQSHLTSTLLIANQKLTDNLNSAATVVNKLCRGYLGRLEFKALRIQHESALVIQCNTRVYVAKKTADVLRWNKIRVVPTLYALKLMRLRSRFTNVKVKGWSEYFDPFTNSFWYCDDSEAVGGMPKSTWEPPEVFEGGLTCLWNCEGGCGSFHSHSHSHTTTNNTTTNNNKNTNINKKNKNKDNKRTTSDNKLEISKICRQTFPTRRQFNTHRITHKWSCPSCSTINTSLTYPTCYVCHNFLSEDGVDLMEGLEDGVKRILNGIRRGGVGFDGSDSDDEDKDENDSNIPSDSDNEDENKLKNVLPTLGPESALSNFTERENLSLEKEQKQKLNHMKQTNTKDSDINSNLPVLPNIKMHDKNNASQKLALLNAVESYKSKDKSKDKDSTSNGNGDNDGNANGTGTAFDTESYQSHSSSSSSLSVIPDTSNTLTLTNELELELELEPTLKTDVATCKEEAYLCSTQYLTVCSRFYNNNNNKSNSGKGMKTRTSFSCNLTTCPRAHPGVRDDCEVLVFPSESKGKGKFYVQVCYSMLTTGACPTGLDCKSYHIYIRPSTRDIILKLYPKNNGLRTTTLASGLVIRGNVTNNVYNKECVLQWNNGDTYTGTLSNNLRNGFGVYRTKNCTKKSNSNSSGDHHREYTGTWLNGVRHGYGTLIHSSGEVYTGQFGHGRMHGVGTLTSANGDVYSGMFENGKYNGICTYTKSNTSTYTGSTVNGVACGLGVLTDRINGADEVYKGYFEANQRSGKGVCKFGDGCTYSGYWRNGVTCGFGIFVSPSPDDSASAACMASSKYVGEWANGKKHGQGRYYFPNHDFYSGSFIKNNAHGTGIYRHFQSGNVYHGQWSNNKRNGLGTYSYGATGSTYVGSFVDNDMSGKGTLTYATGAVYNGEFLNNAKHGKGKFRWPNGNVYTGHFSLDKLAGSGSMLYAAGHKFTGAWAGNRKNGVGEFTYKDGNVYTGHYKDDVIEGKGRMRYLPDTILEESYNGEWANGQRHGRGKYTYRVQDGNTYTGAWVNGLRHGSGVLRYKDGSFYKGDFERERMHGHGTLVAVDGAQYEGAFVDNVKHGHGVQMSSNGVVFTGRFVGGVKEGEGRMVMGDGNAYEGRWKGDVVVGRGKFEVNVGGGGEAVKLRVFGF